MTRQVSSTAVSYTVSQLSLFLQPALPNSQCGGPGSLLMLPSQSCCPCAIGSGFCCLFHGFSIGHAASAPQVMVSSGDPLVSPSRLGQNPCMRRPRSVFPVGFITAYFSRGVEGFKCSAIQCGCAIMQRHAAPCKLQRIPKLLMRPHAPHLPPFHAQVSPRGARPPAPNPGADFRQRYVSP